MDERMLRLKDFLGSYLQSTARSPAELAKEIHRARYPYHHPDESDYDFNLRMNAYKTPGQICTEISQQGAGDFYCHYKNTERRSHPFGDTYVHHIDEMRLLLRSSQLTEDVIVTTLMAGVPMKVVYDAIAEDDRPRIYTKKITIAGINGSPSNLAFIDCICSGTGRWESHTSEIFDTDVMLALLSVDRIMFNESIKFMPFIAEFQERLEKCKAEIRAGNLGDYRSKGNTLMDDIGL